MEDNHALYDNSYVEFNDHLEVCLPYIWTFKNAGYPKFGLA